MLSANGFILLKQYKQKTKKSQHADDQKGLIFKWAFWWTLFSLNALYKENGRATHGCKKHRNKLLMVVGEFQKHIGEQKEKFNIKHFDLSLGSEISFGISKSQYNWCLHMYVLFIKYVVKWKYIYCKICSCILTAKTIY